MDLKYIIHYLNGETEKKHLLVNETKPNVLIAEIKDQLSFENIKYIDVELCPDKISAGDDGFFILNAGNGKCKNRDFSYGLYESREDGEYVLEDVYIPYFALKHNDIAYGVIVTGMATDAWQYISVKDNLYSFKIRFNIDQVTPYESIKLQYNIINGQNTTYSDLAKIYREYQLSNGFKSLKERNNPYLEYMAHSINIRVRMGWKPVPCQIHEQTIENEPPMHIACTFDDVSKLMHDFKNAGIEKAEFCLVGWNVKGHDGRWPQIMPPEESLGGKKALQKLIKTAYDLGYAITCHTNSTDGYSIANNFKKDDVAIKRDGEYSVEAIRWAGGKTYNICPKRAYEISMQTLPEVAELGFRGMHYIDVITCTPPRECNNPNHTLNKKQGNMYFDMLFKDAKQMFGAVGCEGPYDFALKECDSCLYVSFDDYLNSPIKHPLTHKQIPFWQIIYHGIIFSNPYAKTVNATISDEESDILKVIEYGGRPQVYYYAKFVDDGSDWIGKNDFHCHTDEERKFSTKKVKEQIDLYKEFEYLQYEFIEDHEEIEENIFKTTYSGGSYTIVDYNKKTYELSKGAFKNA